MPWSRPSQIKSARIEVSLSLHGGKESNSKHENGKERGKERNIRKERTDSNESSKK